MEDFETRKRKFTEPKSAEFDAMAKDLLLPLQRRHLRLLRISVGILLSGNILLSWCFGDPEIFQRAGNLVIITAIFFSWLRFGRAGFYDKVFSVVRDVFKEIEAKTNPQFTADQVQEIVTLRVSNIHAYAKRLVDKQLLKNELTALALGTLVSGYGDWMLSFVAGGVLN